MNYIGINIKKIRKKWSVTQDEFGQLVGATRGMIMQYENRGTKVKDEVLANIASEAGISKSTLLTREINPEEIQPLAFNVLEALNMYRGGALDGLIEYTAQEYLFNKDMNWPGIPMYDIPVSAGAVTMIRDHRAPEPAYYLHIPAFKDCTFGARVSGDSMYPEIRNGDYVICKEVQSMDGIIYGDIYLIITGDGLETVKYIHPHEDKEDWIKLVPYNKSVPVTPIPKSNIFKVYKVKGVLKGY